MGEKARISLKSGAGIRKTGFRIYKTRALDAKKWSKTAENDEIDGLDSNYALASMLRPTAPGVFPPELIANLPP